MNQGYLFAFVSCLSLACFTLAYEKSICDEVRGLKWKSDSANCSVIYLCFNNRAFKYTCPDDYVTDEEGKTCVPKGSADDKCKQENRPGLCSVGSDLRIPDKDNCARFYACPNNASRNSAEMELKECPFPLLYDEDLKMCGYPDAVKCGSRYEPKDACNVRYPSCKGLPDGLNPWVGREETPYYAVCKRERVMYHGKCSQSVNTQIFNRRTRMCVELR
ncbi:hypothetical protein KUTeg_020979 [Tegillarca granosa]|uniref:Chitin-binding type-2 domain-containing protein n=1 Tax=Tegillarca granosa TaxID=220873 RepID=A0ABQ9EEL8_TEGGR|nr:hypothetical protein KUTeg_020979 [Tegillarca granosa]